MRGRFKPETIERMRAAAIRSWQDPAVRAARSAAISAASKRPGAHEQRSESLRRACARSCVKRAGRPLLRALVDRAYDMLADGNPQVVIVDALQRERGRRGR